ncbi:hypothetical protein FRC04_002006 [Tulasnella sp. 424]|nr:hypothetical protein FRC04_002006 [Tulasnella sp. 424]KAG8968042.1 hypothetical protein FRC05_001675 [Tulasnella sp. 425]
MSSASSFFPNVPPWSRTKTGIPSSTIPLSSVVTHYFNPQKDSRFVNLPEEVLLAILEFLDESRKTGLLRTCKYFQSVVEPVLYRHLILTEGQRYVRSGLLHRTLDSRPDFILYVRTYHGPVIPPHYYADSSQRSAIERAKVLGRRGWTSYESGRAAMATRIFEKAVNIQDLFFIDGHDWIDEKVRWSRLFDAVCRMKLDRLALQIQGRPTYVAPLLRAQPGLTHLHILQGSARLGGLVESDLPMLRSLRSTLHHASVIVPGRPVEDLQLVRALAEQRQDECWFKQLAQSTGPIKRFSMALHNPTDDDLVQETIRMIARYLPSIEHLRLKVGGRMSAAIVSGNSNLDLSSS